MEGIPGAPAPIPHSKIAGPEHYRFAGSGTSGRLAGEPVNQPLVKLAAPAEVAELRAADRIEYISSVGKQVTARAVAKVIDILV